MSVRRTIVTAAAAALVAVPAAQAYVLEGAGYDGPTAGSAASHYTPAALKALGERWQAAADHYSTTGVRPDDRVGVRGVGTTPDVTASVRPDDRVGIRGVPQPVSAPAAVPATDDGFAWGDAGIGAGIACGAALLLAAAMRLLRTAKPGGSLRPSSTA